MGSDIPAALDHIILIKFINRPGSRCDPAGPVVFPIVCLHRFKESIADRIQMTTSIPASKKEPDSRFLLG